MIKIVYNEGMSGRLIAQTETKATPLVLPALFELPPGDCERKEELARGTPLVEDPSLFVEDKEREALGGTGKSLPYLKIDPRKPPEKYWVKPVGRDYFCDEYLGSEILRVVFGIYTPTIRVFNETTQVSTHIPIIQAIALLSKYVTIDETKAPDLKGEVEAHADFKEASRRYELIPSLQIIIDHDTQTEHKIRGPFYGAFIPALLLGDSDFQPSGANFGVVRAGDSFQVAAIDKGDIVILGESYDKLSVRTKTTLEDPLFKFATEDQILFTLNKMDAALKERVFDNIFMNPQVLNTTAFVASGAPAKAKLIKASAESILVHYKQEKKKEGDRVFGPTCLVDFNKRELIRSQLADLIIVNLNLASSPPGYIARLKEMIVSDLRAPYYAHLFLDKKTKQISATDLTNPTLINALTYAFTKELFPAHTLSLLEAFIGQKKAAYSKIQLDIIPSPTGPMLSSRGSSASSIRLSASSSSGTPKGIVIPEPTGERKAAFQKIDAVIARVKEEKNVYALDIIIGCIIDECTKAQKSYGSQYFKNPFKKGSNFVVLMTEVLTQLCIENSPSRQSACLAAFKKFDSQPPFAAGPSSRSPTAS